MARVTGLVPARFLTLAAHLVITIVLFISREENVKACLPSQYTQDEYNNQDRLLIIGLSVSCGLFLLEFIGFFGGISMFVHTTSLLSSHCAGAVSLSFFLFDVWECHIFWWIFGFSNCLPALAEIVAMIGVLGLGKGL